MKKIASIVLASALLFANGLYADMVLNGKEVTKQLAADTVVKGQTAAQAAAATKGLTLTGASTAFYATVAGVLTLVVTAVANDNGTTTTHMSTVHH